ncbi:hypothetical protein E2C01_068601 [Portunus trituberculatus]|uniref:Uncharacterized protein n=1 Tax=Portunus trituberculatus TaxID=210409 RepID=A0A5B7HYB4_PORTR|nr:hypothetical protein [Portunus trituberculatus]
MEGVVARSRDTLNYLFWCLGALHLLVAWNLPPPLLDLEEQLFNPFATRAPPRAPPSVQAETCRVHCHYALS